MPAGAAGRESSFNFTLLSTSSGRLWIDATVADNTSFLEEHPIEKIAQFGPAALDFATAARHAAPLLLACCRAEHLPHPLHLGPLSIM